MDRAEIRDEQCRILLVDDHKLLMEGVRSLLTPYAHLRVVGMALSGHEALALANSFMPHIVVLDLNMPGMNGVETGRGILQLRPATRLLVYTADEEQCFLPELVDMGIMGHVRKSENPQVLLQAIESVRQGKVFVSFSDPGRRVASLLEDACKTADKRPADDLATLSPREKEIFRMLVNGRNTKAIAGELHISPRTAETHKYNIFTKLQAENMGDLMKIAIRSGDVKL